MDKLELEVELGQRMCPLLTKTFPVGTKESALGSRVTFVMKTHVMACVGSPCGVWDRSRECCGMIAHAAPATVVTHLEDVVARATWASDPKEAP